MMETCVLIPSDFSLVLKPHPDPRNIFEMCVSLWANRTLCPGQVFRSDQGVIRLDTLEIYKSLREDNIKFKFGCYEHVQSIDGQDVRHCNWIRFLRVSNNIDEVNMVGLRVKGEVIYQIIRTIPPNGEIIAYYEDYKRSQNLVMEKVLETNKNTQCLATRLFEGIRRDSNVAMETDDVAIDMTRVSKQPVVCHDNSLSEEENKSNNSSNHSSRSSVKNEELGQSLGGPTPEHQSSPLALSLGLDTPPTDRDDDSKSTSSEISVGSEGSHHRYIEAAHLSSESIIGAASEASHNGDASSPSSSLGLDPRRTPSPVSVAPSLNGAGGATMNSSTPLHNGTAPPISEVTPSPNRNMPSTMITPLSNGPTPTSSGATPSSNGFTPSPNGMTPSPNGVTPSPKGIDSKIHEITSGAISSPNGAVMSSPEDASPSSNGALYGAMNLSTNGGAHVVRVPVKRNRERQWLPCDVCGKKFDRPSLLRRHVRTHTGEKPHSCDVCGKAFSTSSSLNTHRRIHSGEKPHQCQICGKRFTASSNLYYHRMTHNKEKPHKCTLCSKSFPTPGDLKSHMYVHNGSWPYKCEVCNRGFSKQTNLKNHLLLHTGDKPHHCPLCGKRFALQCNLRTHMKTHEGETQDECYKCGKVFLSSTNQLVNGNCHECLSKNGGIKTEISPGPVIKKGLVSPINSGIISPSSSGSSHSPPSVESARSPVERYQLSAMHPSMHPDRQMAPFRHHLSPHALEAKRAAVMDNPLAVNALAMHHGAGMMHYGMGLPWPRFMVDGYRYLK